MNSGAWLPIILLESSANTGTSTGAAKSSNTQWVDPQNSNKHPKWPILGVLGGTKNGTWGKEKENSEQLAHLLVFV